MRARVRLGTFLVRLGRFIQSLAVMVMKPDDLIEFTRRTYSTPEDIEGWSEQKLVDLGLNQNEKEILEKLPRKSGRLLLLGVGGGREAIPLARMGFQVTGVDFIHGLVQKAQENARKKGVEISGLVQEISRLEVNANSYDVIWLSYGMYSCIPTQERRLKMLYRIKGALKPEGYFVCQFHWDPSPEFSPRVEFLRRVFSFGTLGNLRYEKGDKLSRNIEFIHAFGSEDELVAEFKEGGFKVVHFEKPEGVRGNAILCQDTAELNLR